MTIVTRIRWRDANVSKWEGYRATNKCDLETPLVFDFRRITITTCWFTTTSGVQDKIKNQWEKRRWRWDGDVEGCHRWEERVQLWSTVSFVWVKLEWQRWEERAGAVERLSSNNTLEMFKITIQSIQEGSLLSFLVFKKTASGVNLHFSHLLSALFDLVMVMT